MPMVSFRLAPTLHEKLVTLCEKREVSVTDFYRQLTERVVDHVDDLDYNAERGAAGKLAIAPIAVPTPHGPVRRLSNDKPVGFAIGGGEITARKPYQKGEHKAMKKRRSDAE